jgi:hypothetical protein
MPQPSSSGGAFIMRLYFYSTVYRRISITLRGIAGFSWPANLWFNIRNYVLELHLRRCVYGVRCFYGLLKIWDLNEQPSVEFDHSPHLELHLNLSDVGRIKGSSERDSQHHSRSRRLGFPACSTGYDTMVQETEPEEFVLHPHSYLYRCGDD